MTQSVPTRLGTEVLGPSQISATMNTDHVVPEMKRDAVDRTERLLTAHP